MNPTLKSYKVESETADRYYYYVKHVFPCFCRFSLPSLFFCPKEDIADLPWVPSIDALKDLHYQLPNTDTSVRAHLKKSGVNQLLTGRIKEREIRQ